MKILLCVCLCPAPGGLSDIILLRTLQISPQNVPTMLLLRIGGAHLWTGKQVKRWAPAAPHEAGQMCSRADHRGETALICLRRSFSVDQYRLQHQGLTETGNNLIQKLSRLFFGGGGR